MMDWISVKDRLPDTGRRVFVTTQSLDRYDTMIAHYDAETLTWIKPIKPCRVIAWMELPEPYKSNRTGDTIDRILKADPDYSDQDGDYIERGRIVRILRGLE